jgi:hypothetical protein
MPIIVPSKVEALDKHLNVLMENISTSGLSFAPRLKLKSGEIDSLLEPGGKSGPLGVYHFPRTLLELPGGGKRTIETALDYATAPSFRAYVYGMIHNVLHHEHLRKIAKCEWCGKFCVIAHLNKDKYCSDNCRRLRDQRDFSGNRHMRREKKAREWLLTELARSIKTTKQRQSFFAAIVRPIFRNWKSFNDWKLKASLYSPEDLWKTLPKDIKIRVGSRMREFASRNSRGRA